MQGPAAVEACMCSMQKLHSQQAFTTIPGLTEFSVEVLDCFDRLYYYGIWNFGPPVPVSQFISTHTNDDF